MAPHQPTREHGEPGRTIVGGGRLTGVLAAGVFTAAIIVSLLGWRAAADGPAFEAQSVVGPVELKLNPVRVARTVSALDSHRTDAPGAVDTAVRPVRATRLTLVTARHDDPTVAASAANERAERLVEDLNRAGPGVATFDVLTRADQPGRPRSEPGPAPFLLMGLVAGSCLAVAVVGVARWAGPRTVTGAGAML